MPTFYGRLYYYEGSWQAEPYVLIAEGEKYQLPVSFKGDYAGEEETLENALKMWARMASFLKIKPEALLPFDDETKKAISKPTLLYGIENIGMTAFEGYTQKGEPIRPIVRGVVVGRVLSRAADELLFTLNESGEDCPCCLFESPNIISLRYLDREGKLGVALLPCLGCLEKEGAEALKKIVGLPTHTPKDTP